MKEAHTATPRDFMASMYEPYESERQAFGDNWIGPDTYESWKETLVARYDNDPESDGQPVEVFCTAAPARFYTVRALAGQNSVKESLPSYDLRTGSGQSEMAAQIAKAISEGMLALHLALTETRETK